jgi:hypothetical protein
MLAVNLDVSLQFSVSCFFLQLKFQSRTILAFVRAGRALVCGRYRSGARGMARAGNSDHGA